MDWINLAQEKSIGVVLRKM